MANSLFDMTKQDLRNVGEGIVKQMLQNQNTSLDKVYDNIAKLDNPALAWMAGKEIKQIRAAASNNGINPDGYGGYKKLAESQFNVLLDSVARSIYDAKEQVEKSNPPLSGKALSDKISELTKVGLKGGAEFNKALSFVNGLSKVADKNMPDVTIDQVTEYANGWLVQQVPTQQTAQKAVATPSPSDKSTANEGKKPAFEEKKPAPSNSPAPTTATSVVAKQPDPPKWQEFSNADANEITRNLAAKGLIGSQESMVAVNNLLNQGFNSKKPTTGKVGDGKDQGSWFTQIGDMWNTHGQPIWDTVSRWLMAAVTFVMELFSNGFDFQKAGEKFQLQTAASSTGKQMSAALFQLREAMPFGENGLAYTDAKTGATHEDYLRIHSVRNDVIMARNALQEVEKGGNVDLRETARVRLNDADQRMAALDEKNVQKFGVDSEQLWKNFVDHKRALMNETASLMGVRARANGLVDTPINGTFMIDAWRNDAAFTKLVEPHKSAKPVEAKSATLLTELPFDEPSTRYPAREVSGILSYDSIPKNSDLSSNQLLASNKVSAL